MMKIVLISIILPVFLASCSQERKAVSRSLAKFDDSQRKAFKETGNKVAGEILKGIAAVPIYLIGAAIEGSLNDNVELSNRTRDSILPTVIWSARKQARLEMKPIIDGFDETQSEMYMVGWNDRLDIIDNKCSVPQHYMDPSGLTERTKLYWKGFHDAESEFSRLTLVKIKEYKNNKHGGG